MIVKSEERIILSIACICIIASVIIPVYSVAQELADMVGADGQDPKKEAGAENADIAFLKQEIEWLDDQYKKEINKLEAKGADQMAELERKIQELKAAQEEMAFNASMSEGMSDLEDDIIQRFRVYGFLTYHSVSIFLIKTARLVLTVSREIGHSICPISMCMSKVI